AFAVSADGQILCCGSEDSTILLWDLRAPVVAARPRKLQVLWSDLGSPDAAHGYRVLGVLAAAGEQAVVLVRERLRPAPREIPGAARQLAALDSEQFEVRTRAAAELEELGSAVGPLLRQALRRGPSAEARRVLRDLLGKIDGPGLSPVVLREV